MVKIAVFAAAALLIAPSVIAAPNPAGSVAQQEELAARTLLALYERELNQAGISARDIELDERGFGKILGKIGKTALSILKREQGLDTDMYVRDIDELEQRGIGKIFGKIGKTALSFLKREEDGMDMYERDFDELEERGIGKIFGKIGKTALSILKREEDAMDMYGRDLELDERDFLELDERDLSELDERSFKSVMGKIGKTVFSILKREEDMDMFEREYAGLDELD